MPQLEEDEWPQKHEPTTAEKEHLKRDEGRPPRDDTRAEYPPKLPPEALPTKD